MRPELKGIAMAALLAGCGEKNEIADLVDCQNGPKEKSIVMQPAKNEWAKIGGLAIKLRRDGSLAVANMALGTETIIGNNPDLDRGRSKVFIKGENILFKNHSGEKIFDISKKPGKDGAPKIEVKVSCNNDSQPQDAEAPRNQ